MLINLTDVFTSEGKVKEIPLTWETESFSYMGETYPVKQVADLTLTLTNIGIGSVLIRAGGRFILEMPCDRCLTPMEVPVEISCTYEAVSPENAEGTQEEEELHFLSGYELDTDALIHNEILINMPVKVLCREDCKGICPSCGKNLNEGECGCDTFVPDPRMAAIKDIFNANKEV